VANEQAVREVEEAQVAHFAGQAENLVPLTKYLAAQAQLLFKVLKAAPETQVKHLFLLVVSLLVIHVRALKIRLFEILFSNKF
jgi:hypothetical protein